MAGHQSAGWDQVAAHLERFGASRELRTFALIALVEVIRPWTRVRRALPALVSAVVANLVAIELKAVIDRPRPPRLVLGVSVPGSAMPSNIAAMVAALAIGAVVAVPAGRRRLRMVVGAVGGTLMAVSGVATVYVGAHWTTDVLAGWALGAGVAVGITALSRVVGSGPRRAGAEAAVSPRGRPGGR